MYVIEINMASALDAQSKLHYTSEDRFCTEPGMCLRWFAHVVMVSNNCRYIDKALITHSKQMKRFKMC